MQTIDNPQTKKLSQIDNSNTEEISVYTSTVLDLIQKRHDVIHTVRVYNKMSLIKEAFGEGSFITHSFNIEILGGFQSFHTIQIYNDSVKNISKFTDEAKNNKRVFSDIASTILNTILNNYIDIRLDIKCESVADFLLESNLKSELDKIREENEELERRELRKIKIDKVNADELIKHDSLKDDLLSLSPEYTIESLLEKYNINKGCVIISPKQLFVFEKLMKKDGEDFNIVKFRKESYKNGRRHFERIVEKDEISINCKSSAIIHNTLEYKEYALKNMPYRHVTSFKFTANKVNKTYVLSKEEFEKYRDSGLTTKGELFKYLRDVEKREYNF